MRPLTRARSTGDAADTVTVRAHRDFRTLLSRIEPGDLVVIERRDLDAASARLLAERRPAAVLNAAEFVSGRFANLGPAVLLEAGVGLLEGEPDEVRTLKAGTSVRLEGDTVHTDRHSFTVRRLTAEDVRDRTDRARVGMSSQLDTFAHTASELLRREEAILLNDRGLPRLRTRVEGRTVVVVGPHATAADVRRLRRFLREQRPVLVGVDAGADLVARRRARRRRLDLLVLGADAVPTDRVLRRAREVVLHGATGGVRRQVDKLEVPTHSIDTGLSSTDVALLLARAGGARLVVPVGDPATLEALIDRERSDQASAVLTRMRLGTSVVEASAVPLLYTGRVRMWHLLLVLLLAVAVLGFTVAATPIGHDWWRDVSDRLPARLGGGS